MTPTVAIDARLFDRDMTGDSAYWKGLVRALAATDHGITVLLFSNSQKPQEIPERENFRWINVPGGDRWWSLVRFPIKARRAGANVVHTQYNLSPLVRRGGVTTVHDVSFFIGPEWFPPKDRWLLRTMVPASVRRAAKVVTVSETSRAEILRHVPAARGKVAVTYNALGPNIALMPQEEAMGIIQDLGAPDQYLLTVGTRWPRKNMALAVEAARLAGKPLVVTGKQGWGPGLEGAHLTGYVSDRELTALYQCAKLYLAPSFHEGFGIPLLEAFECRCPVLCSSGGALPEVSGGAAEVMSCFEPEAWAERVKALWTDSSKLEAMKDRGSIRVKTFDWAETARKTVEVYREVAG